MAARPTTQSDLFKAIFGGDDTARRKPSKVKVKVKVKVAAETFDTAARAAVRRLCMVGEAFTTDEVWAALDGVRPPEPRALGTLMQGLQRQGVIEATSEYQTSKRKACNRRPVRVWRPVRRGAVDG